MTHVRRLVVAGAVGTTHYGCRRLVASPRLFQRGRNLAEGAPALIRQIRRGKGHEGWNINVRELVGTTRAKGQYVPNLTHHQNITATRPTKLDAANARGKRNSKAFAINSDTCVWQSRALLYRWVDILWHP